MKNSNIYLGLAIMFLIGGLIMLVINSFQISIFSITALLFSLAFFLVYFMNR